MEAISGLKDRVARLWGYLDLARKQEEIALFERQASEPSFWTDSAKAQKIQKQLKTLQWWVDAWKSLNTQVEDMETLALMAQDEGDETTLKEVTAAIPELEARVRELELKKMLSGEDDERPAILSIHPGAGGTESQDWARMLLRMYRGWLDKKGFKYEVLDEQPAEDAGIKSATLEVQSEYAYGYLRSEVGVHRLVRISPFDANARRHTSFTAVHVYPVVEDVEIEINEADIKVDTFRAGGAGGQHINKTDSAVRMTHIPTGIVVSCQSERSQHKNRSSALKMLRSKIYQKHREEEEARRESKLQSKLKIEWGSQIRNYVLQPYQMVKDARTDYETSDADRVLNGDLDGFINAYLLAADEERQKK
ncbi:MAG TPA: peptide chain release factor 2 [Fibrobacteria bacterium]|nr:peptide chain release factor 2 [Fibrobacteria bacterium]